MVKHVCCIIIVWSFPPVFLTIYPPFIACGLLENLPTIEDVPTNTSILGDAQLPCLINKGIP